MRMLLIIIGPVPLILRKYRGNQYFNNFIQFDIKINTQHLGAGIQSMRYDLRCAPKEIKKPHMQLYMFGREVTIVIQNNDIKRVRVNHTS